VAEGKMRMEWVVIGVTIAIVVFVVQIFNNLVRMRTLESTT